MVGGDAALRPWPLAVALVGRCLATQSRTDARAVVASDARADLPPEQRHWLARTVYRTLQQQRRADFALDGVVRLPPHVRPAALVLATAVDDREITPAEAADWMDRLAESPVRRIDWERVASPAARIAGVRDPVVRFGLTHSIPDWLAQRFLDEFGGADGAEPLVAALGTEPPRTIRANLLRVADREALREELAAVGVPSEATPHAPHGLVVGGHIPLFGLAAFREGRFEQQDEASQLVAMLVAPPPSGRVLDACAGSGGKTLALAATMQNRGEILALDTNARRIAELVKRRRRAGVHSMRAQHVEEGPWPEAVRTFASRADRILLDVPCSGIGSWRRRPEARFELTAESCTTLRRTQQDLLQRAIECLRPGARLIYSTCTVFRDENEQQIEAAMAADRELELVPVAEILGRAAATPITDPRGVFLELRPDRHGCDGFFAAVLRRRRAGGRGA